MKTTCVLFGLSLLVAYAVASPIVKREAESEDLSPLNEVYVVEAENMPAADGDDRTDRDKRKIGVVKLGVSNGIINFVFGKLDSFLDAKTHALGALDDANRVKNAAFGIDNTHSATSKFINDFVASKIQAATGSIGPVINGAQAFFATAKNGLTGAVASKLASLSSLSGGLSAGVAGKADVLSAGHSVGGGIGGSTAGILGNLLSSKISSLSSLSQGSGIAQPGSPSEEGAGVSVGAYANLGGGETVSTTTEDIPEFDRTRVSLDIPGPAFGTGFSLVTNVSKILSSLILNSARRTQTVLEVFKPFFRGAFAIKGLPSDNPQ